MGDRRGQRHLREKDHKRSCPHRLPPKQKKQISERSDKDLAMTFIDRSCRAQVEEKIKPIDRQCSEVRDGTPDSCHSKLLTRLNFNKMYRAKTSSSQRKIFTYFSEPWRLCVSARVRVFSRFSCVTFRQKFQCLVSLLSYGRELPVLLRMIESLEKTFFLFFLGNVEKEFSNDHAVARQVAVEITDVLAKAGKESDTEARKLTCRRALTRLVLRNSREHGPPRALASGIYNNAGQ
jgi:hypothetical protein